MKKIIFIYAAFIFCMVSCNSKKDAGKTATETVIENNDEKYAAAVNNGLQKDTVKKSVRRQTIVLIDSNEISVRYHSPGVRGRVIWGGLVPYDQVWVTGAHSATTISFTKDIIIGNTPVPAGSYAIFSIPGKAAWTFILNSNYRQHLADDYTEQEDIVRINVMPETLADTIQRLTYEIKPNGRGTGSISIAWETIRLSVPFVVKQQSTGNATMAGGRTKLTGIVTDSKRDLVCYMPVTAGITDTVHYKKKLYGFCSEECKRLFVSDPKHYLADFKE